MCMLLKLHYAKFDVSRLFLSNVIQEKPLGFGSTSLGTRRVKIILRELKTKTNTFNAIDLKVKTVLMFDLHCTAYNVPLYTPFLQHRKGEI